jgi:predicted  nucleic acid-binding Zn-ribbon protein
MGMRQCFGCGKKYDNSFRFCPHCGRKKGASVEEIRLKKTDDLKNTIEENVKIHRDIMSKTDEILEVLKEKGKTTYEMQRKFTEKIIR